MRHLALAAAAGLFLTASAAQAQSTVAVRGHVNKDGTYVAPHVRTAPNETRTDNWTSRPNVNPYTGKAGTRDPYAPPANPYASNPYKPYKPYTPK